MRRLSLTLSLVAATGCFLVLDPDELQIATLEDGGHAVISDAGDVDAGSSDAGDVDAGSSDAGGVDAGSSDAGSVDAGCPRDMVEFSSGEFRLSATNEFVAVARFCLDRTEVPKTSYLVFGAQAGNTPGTDGACNWDLDDRDTHPINCVTWEQATAYCASIDKRLASEAEWEWAARGGQDTLLYPWGNSEPSAAAHIICWSGADSRSGTCAVATGDIAPSGLYDLAGNVSEWTSDEDSGGMVVRGGSWSTTDARELRSSSRVLAASNTADAKIGFRCAKTP